jgi:hypothetical protein
MQRLLQEKPHLKVVNDQIGAPTWAGTIAASTRALIERWQAGQAGAWGTYHLTAQGETSWFGFAQAIANSSRHKACLRRAAADPSSAYPTPAQAPAQLAPGLLAAWRAMAGQPAALARRIARLSAGQRHNAPDPQAHDPMTHPSPPTPLAQPRPAGAVPGAAAVAAGASGRALLPQRTGLAEPPDPRPLCRQPAGHPAPL